MAHPAINRRAIIIMLLRSIIFAIIFILGGASRKLAWLINMKIFKLLSFILLVISVFVLGISYLLSSQNFQIAHVTVSGNEKISLKEISSIMSIPKGENIFKLDSGKTIENLESNPWIKKAVIKRKLPHELIITVKERTPFAVLRLPKKDEYLIDQEGFVIESVTKEEAGKDMMKLMARSLAVNPRVGKKLTDPILTEVLHLCRVFAQVPPWEGHQLDQIDWSSETGVILRFKDLSTEMRLGRDGFRDKLTKAKFITEYLEVNKAIAYIDLNYKDKVIVKYY